ncbi:pimeloyl-ACP methyl ester carboxylesterase [Paraburkholderia sp. BL8N3]|jgi:pimeloyl-ACP methyl ester carboxylesterase|nr:alpha/beta hydrolase [Paraburkholderia sp. BL8N3]TCK38879.1 pimeloyl-ACP methyl ester carboxylesterase [Paraburkholderia sp. BL8N3]
MNQPADNTSPTSLAELPATEQRGPLRVEYQWLSAERAGAGVAVFLHEGLGSIAMWKDWPQSLCDALGCRGLVYSRPGYGRSTPREAGEKWSVDFMHRQAHDVLPALLDTIGIDADERRRMWVIGHSDGGSIALLYAAAFPQALRAAVVIAPHVVVEQMSVDAIGKTKHAYERAGLREKLARYHDNVDSAFFGWNDIWLDPAFRAWDITDVLPSIQCPLLAIQGCDDEYGTMLQIDTIRQRLPHARLVKLPDCGHSPHRQAPQELNDAIVAFAASL